MFILSLSWNLLFCLPSCQEKYDLFYNILLVCLDIFFPKVKVKIHCRDKTWITPDLKTLISKRQQALADGNTCQYQQLQNPVNRAVKQAKPNHFYSQVNHLKSATPRK